MTKPSLTEWETAQRELFRASPQIAPSVSGDGRNSVSIARLVQPAETHAVFRQYVRKRISTLQLHDSVVSKNRELAQYIALTFFDQKSAPKSIFKELRNIAFLEYFDIEAAKGKSVTNADIGAFASLKTWYRKTGKYLEGQTPLSLVAMKKERVRRQTAISKRDDRVPVILKRFIKYVAKAHLEPRDNSTSIPGWYLVLSNYTLMAQDVAREAYIDREGQIRR